MAASMSKTLASICSISLSIAKVLFCIHPATLGLSYLPQPGDTLHACRPEPATRAPRLP